MLGSSIRTTRSRQPRGIRVSTDRLARGFARRCKNVALSGLSYISDKQPRVESFAMLIEARRAYIIDAVGRRLDFCGDLANRLARSSSADIVIASLIESFHRAAGEYGKAGAAAQQRVTALLFVIVTALRFGHWFDSSSPDDCCSRHRSSTRTDLHITYCRAVRRLIASVERDMPSIWGRCAPTGCRWLLPPPRRASIHFAV